MSIRDFHIHAQVLTKPDTVHAFIRAAIDKGINEICITDHMPLSISSADDRIPTGSVRAYCTAVRRLAVQYETQIAIRCGIEIDYHPSVLEEIHAVLREGDFDYILGSSHLHVIHADTLSKTYGTRIAYAAAMIENTRLAAQSGLFDAIPHIDMYRWIFSNPERFPLWDDAFSEERLHVQMDAVLNAIRDAGIYLEINPHFAESTHCMEHVYPSSYLMSFAYQKRLRFIYGSDAHTPASVGCMLPDLRVHPVYRDAIAAAEGRKET